MSLLLFLFSSLATASGYTCGFQKSDQDLRHQTALFLYSNESSYCKPLDVGSSKVVDFDRNNSPTGLPHGYFLERKSKSQYHLKFNIEFGEMVSEKQMTQYGQAEVTTWVSKQNHNSHWITYANQCLKDFESQLKGPSGETLKISLEQPQVKSSVPKVKVSIDRIDRSTSTTWDKDITCTAVLHEILHLAGLVDEYEEGGKGFRHDANCNENRLVTEGFEKPAYDCRKINGPQSIMGNYDGLLGHKSYKKVLTSYCKCTADQEKCNEVFQKQKLEKNYRNVPKECPTGFSSHESGKGEAHNIDEKGITDIYRRAFAEAKAETLSDKNERLLPIVSVESVPEQIGKPLLTDAQWNSIIFPGCLEKNRVYYQDAANSYRTSVERGGEGCLDTSWAEKAK